MRASASEARRVLVNAAIDHNVTSMHASQGHLLKQVVVH